MTRHRKWQSVFNDGYPFGVLSYAFTDNPSWSAIKQAIYQNGPVLALVDCGDGWYANGWSESVTCPMKLGTYDSGHFVVLWGYDDKYVYFRNSWSEDWVPKPRGSPSSDTVNS